MVNTVDNENSCQIIVFQSLRDVKTDTSLNKVCVLLFKKMLWMKEKIELILWE